MDRRAFLTAAACALATPQGLRARGASGPDSLLDAAAALARTPYRALNTVLPAPFAGLDYDAFRGIRPAQGRSAMLPVGGGLAVDLLPPGLYFPDPVRIDLPDDRGWRNLPFSPRLFDFSPRYFAGVTIPEEAPGAGFSGLRLRAPINDNSVLDEFLVMQGASYFRAVGQAMAYGLSARALAIGSGDPGPEEFPRFTHIRLHAGDAGAAALEAVLDSPSVAGHLAMTAHPGAVTRLAVAVTLFPRAVLSRAGIAPLTSMYLKGPARASVSDDFRPRVHDSDVLVIENGAGETLWRPIANPAGIEISAFADKGPRAFGLFQTPRAFSDYEDGEALYHRRPSAQVVPQGDWGRGAVTLVEIPTADEFMDNIVAFWRPEAPLLPGTSHRFDYDILWHDDAPEQGAGAQILQSRAGRQHEMDGTLRYVVDFGAAPDGLTPDLTTSVPDVLFGETLHRLPDGRLRTSFLLRPDAAPSVELRLVLRDDAGRAASPVWLHRWTPARDGGV
jgi:glucans biosynthesis protein